MFVVVVLLTTTGTAIAQTPHPILRYFTGSVLDDQVRLSWAIFGGSSCEGIIIQRSIDGVVFETIGDIAGICGSPDADVPYTFTDESPLQNQINYYRLELGSQGYSTPVSVNFVLLNDQGYNLRLNSGQKSVSIVFPNTGRDIADVELFDIMGRRIHYNQTSESYTTIPLTSLPAGIYIFRISSNEKLISGKFYSPG